ncbi:hypothetical protein DSO57_1016036 [Entomophthora muscae]|uniref:Uncharacterized protein n=1 Tax=Entomophthora muscae TaxID=34485 RepID=A0ACC2UE91_9FUNG|nr:hypothetical protein DSO57_1016036 [Entomophthora muscae]
MTAPLLTRVNGNLIFDGADYFPIPSLEFVGGSLAIAHIQAKNIVLPIKTIGKEFIVKDCPDLTSLSVPRLTQVGTNVEISDVQTLNLDALQSIGANFTISNVGLKDLDLPIKEIGESFVINGCPRLFFLYLGALESVGGDFKVRGNPAFESLKINNLTKVGGKIMINQPILKDIHLNSSLTNSRLTFIAAVTDCNRLRSSFQRALENLSCTSTTKPGQEMFIALTIN